MDAVADDIIQAHGFQAEKKTLLTPVPAGASEPAKNRNVSVGGSEPSEPVEMMVASELRLRPDGTQCAYLYNVPLAGPSPVQDQINGLQAAGLVNTYGECPDSPVDAGGDVTPAGAAAHVWHQLVQLSDREL